MEQLAWFATTPEGEQLGKLAAKLVEVRWVPVPIWFAPLEPFRWLINALSSGYSHIKWLTITYSLLSMAAGLTVFLTLKASRWQRALSAFLASINVLLTLSGGFVAVKWFESVMGFGVRWIVPEDAPFVLANFHTHTTQSNGFLTPEQAVLWHMRRGYSAVGITDSNTVSGGKIIREFVEREGLTVIVLVGEEFRGKSHLVLLNIKSDISPREFDVPEAIREAKRQGGIVIAAHPWSGRNSIEELFEWGVDGFEITNGSVLGDEKLQELCKRHKLAVLGSLDFRGGYAPKTATVLPKWATTPEKVAKALKEGDCAVIYLSNRVSVSGHDPLKSWLREMDNLWRTGRMANFTGLAFWVAILLWLRRIGKGKNLTNPMNWSHRKFFAAIAFALLLFVFASFFGVWAMARDLKQGWFPPIPLIVAIWAVACSVNWLIWWRVTIAKLIRKELSAVKAES